MITCLLAVSVLGGKSQAQDLLSNVYGRDYRLLNGKWGAIVDLYDQGERMQVYKNRKPQDNKQFYEYSFDGGDRKSTRLNSSHASKSRMPSSA